jgi:hypothetical protein
LAAAIFIAHATFILEAADASRPSIPLLTYSPTA